MKQYQLLIIAGLAIASTGLYSSEPKALEEESKEVQDLNSRASTGLYSSEPKALEEESKEVQDLNSRSDIDLLFNSKKRSVTTGDIAGLTFGAPIHASFFAHELGHAAVNKVLTGNQIDVRLGAIPLFDQSLMKNHIGKANTKFGTFTLHSGFPVGGFCVKTQPKPLETDQEFNERQERTYDLSSPAEEIAFFSAGPIAGAAAGLGMRRGFTKAITYIDQSDMQRLPKLAKVPLRFSRSLSSYAIFENLCNFTPYIEGTDGYKIKQALEKMK